MEIRTHTRGISNQPPPPSPISSEHTLPTQPAALADPVRPVRASRGELSAMHRTGIDRAELAAPVGSGSPRVTQTAGIDPRSTNLARAAVSADGRAHLAVRSERAAR